MKKRNLRACSILYFVLQTLDQCSNYEILPHYKLYKTDCALLEDDTRVEVSKEDH
ncbi:hypothetical protein ALC53_07626 [Atta colombica]|uniref:Uncharacterized protein n=1 Tax=Atta colombica TaxID=520822 RepID=A0A195BCA8_9HYME|nr:hypothetical protein ALC53_07626 [Atta colombica]